MRVGQYLKCRRVFILEVSFSLWVHMRNWPLVVKNFILNTADDVLTLGLKLHEITERLTASEYFTYEINILEDLVVEYLDLRKKVRVDFPNLFGRPKPKHHFLSHYAELIKVFGPPLSYWTGRFEAKHRVAKSFAESAKNVKNITKTLSERQQMRAASVFYSGMFNSQAYSLPQQVSYKKNVPSDTPFHQELKNFMSEKDMLCSEVHANGQFYKNGDLVILEVEDSDKMKVGVIQTILIKNDAVYFVSKVYHCERHWLRYFESLDCDEVCSFTDSRKIADFKPLIKRGTMVKFYYVLHHNISFAYK